MSGAVQLAGHQAGWLTPPAAGRTGQPGQRGGPDTGRARRRFGPGPGGAAHRGRDRHQRRAARGTGRRHMVLRVTDHQPDHRGHRPGPHQGRAGRGTRPSATGRIPPAPSAVTCRTASRWAASGWRCRPAWRTSAAAPPWPSGPKPGEAESAPPERERAAPGRAEGPTRRSRHRQHRLPGPNQAAHAAISS